MQYVFTAVLTKDADGSLFVSFPDIPGCNAKGKDALTAVQEAENVLGLCLFDMEQRKIEIPMGRLPNEISLKAGQFTSVVAVDTEKYRDYANKTIDCAVTIPAWMGKMVEKTDIDFARMLERSLKREAGFPILGDEEDFGTERSRKPIRILQAGGAAGARPLVPGPRPLAGRGGRVNPDQAAFAQQMQTYDGKPKKTGGLDSKFTYLVLGLSVLTVIVGVFWYMVTFTNWIDHWFIPDYSTEMAVGGGRTFSPEEIAELRRLHEEDEAFREDQLPDDYVGEGFLPPGFDLNDSQEYSEEYTSSNTDDRPTTVQGFRALHDNAEIVGILTIAGTDIHYPILQGGDNYFYRSHDVYGAPSASGAIFVDSASTISSLDLNTIIFGSNLADGTQFAQLSYFNNANFFNSSPAITLTTDYGTFNWEVFSFYIDYNNRTFGSNQFENWDRWLDNFWEHSMHQNAINLGNDDQIITLIAESSNGSDRYVLHARLI